MRREIIFLLIILLIAFFFRIWQLDTIPPGLYPDEAINGNEAITDPGKIFYPENNGREGLFINLIAGSFSIFGISIWSIRIISALIGILTVLGLYLLTKELFNQDENGSRFIALLASFFLAVSFWHVNFSRIGFRAILVPLILVFTFYFLSEGFRSQRMRDFIFSGLIFGLGFYTYIAFRSTVILLLVVLFLWWLIYKKQSLQKKFLSFAICHLSFVILITLPLGIYFLENPEYFVSRAAGVSVFANETPIKALGESLIKHLGMFNFSGDFNWRHNISGSPILFWPVGILFLVGLIISLKNIFTFLKDYNPPTARQGKDKKYFLFSTFCFLLSWFFIMLLPGILTSERIPHSLRCIGAIPPTFIFAAIGCEFLIRKIKEKVKIKRDFLSYKLIISVLVLLVISFIFAQYSRYFILWGKSPEVENAFSKNYVEIGNYLNDLEPGIQKYVIVNQSGVPVPYPAGLPMPAQTIMFAERTKFKTPKSIYLLPEDLEEIKIKNKGAIVLMQYDKDLILELWKKFPQGEIEEKNGVWVYHIETY